jgi:hypothetical protein
MPAEQHSRSKENHGMTNQPDICLGCGNTYLGAYCLECEALAAGLIQTSHWPLETSLSPAALSAIETGVRIMLERLPYEGQTSNELHNLANNIRAHLQHARAAQRKATSASTEKDPLLL